MGILGVAMTKTILFISPTGTMDNGAEISIFNLMKFLVSKGFRVINVFPDYRVPVQKNYLEQMKNADVQAIGIPAVKWWWEEAPGGLPGTHYQRVKSYEDNIKRIREILNQNKVDLVISNTANVFQGALAAAEENIRHFWLIHEFPEGEFGYYKDKLDFIEYYSDQIFAVSGALQKELSQLLTDKSILSFIPYSQISGTNLKTSSSHRIIQIGRITENKNQLELIKAYHNSNISNVPLIFIGAEDEEYAKKCKSYVKKNDIKNVHFIGFLEKPWDFLTDKDICVFTSKVETFGMVYSEALINSIPTIVSNNKGYRSVKDLFIQGEMYCLGDIADLSRHILNLLTNFSMKKNEMVQNKEKITAIYNLENAYKCILKHINEDVEINVKEKDKFLNLKGVKSSKIDVFKKFLKKLFVLKKL